MSSEWKAVIEKMSKAFSSAMEMKNAFQYTPLVPKRSYQRKE